MKLRRTALGDPTAALRSASSAAPLGYEAPAGNQRFPLLDPLRGIAAASVFLYHFAGQGTRVHGLLGKLFDHGDFGVVLFFLISGFLLYRPFVTARQQDRPQPSAKNFYLRRVLRIVPAYWVALSILAGYPGLAGFGSRWPLLYGFGQIYDPHTRFAGIAPAWSLCIEVSFYALLPLYAICVRTLLNRLSTEVWCQSELLILGALAVLSLVFNRELKGSGTISNLEFTLPGTFYLFAGGMGLAVVSCHWHRTSVPALLRRFATAIWLLALALYAVIAVTIPRQRLGSVNPLWEVLAALMLLPAIVNAEGLGSRLLRSKPFVKLGVISYAFYLWHQSLIHVVSSHIGSVVLAFVVSAVATVGIATVSYHLVETPFLRIKLNVSDRWPPFRRRYPVASDDTKRG